MEATADLGCGMDYDIFGTHAEAGLGVPISTETAKNPAAADKGIMVECLLHLMDPSPPNNLLSHDSLLGRCASRQPLSARHQQPERLELGELAKASQRALVTAARKNQLAVQVFGKPSLPGAWQGCPTSAWCNSPQDHLGPCNCKATIPGMAAYAQFMECMTDNEEDVDGDHTHTSRGGTHESDNTTAHGQADSSACTTHHHMEDANSTGCDGPALPSGLLSAFHSQHSLELAPAGHVKPRSVMRSASMATMMHPMPHALATVCEEPRAASMPVTAAGSPMAADLPTSSLWPPLSLACALHPFCLDESCPGATNVELLEAPDDVLDTPGSLDCDTHGLTTMTTTGSNPSTSGLPCSQQPPWMGFGHEHHFPVIGGPKNSEQRRKALRATRSLPNFRHGAASSAKQGASQQASLDCFLATPHIPTAESAQPSIAALDILPPATATECVTHTTNNTSTDSGLSFMVPVDLPGQILDADLNKLLTEGFDSILPAPADPVASAAAPSAAVPPQQPIRPFGKPCSRLPEVPPPQISGNKKRVGPPVSTCARPVPNPRGPDVGCTACGSTVTPVWRAGPQGPKTLCNACGVRYMKVAKRR